MNSLQQLNNYALQSRIRFTDDRPADFGSFVGNLPATTVFVTEDARHTITYGGEFVGLTALDNESDQHVTLTLDFSAAQNPYVNWPSAPFNVEFENPSRGVFVAKYIQVDQDFTYLINNTQVTLNDQDTDFNYTVKASWPGNARQQLFTAVVVEDSDETNFSGLDLTSVGLPPFLLFDPSVTPTPQIVDQAVNQLLNLTFTSSRGSTLAVGSDTPTSEISIQGTKEQINLVLSTIRYHPVFEFYNQVDTIAYSVQVISANGNYISESGTFDFTPEIFGIVNDLSDETITVNDLQVDLFDLLPTVPTVESQYPNEIHELRFDYTTGEINGVANSITFTGTVAQLNTQLASVIFDITEQSVSSAVNYTLNYQSFVLDSGSFTTTVPQLFAINNTPTTVVFSDQRDRVLFESPTVPTVVDNTVTGNYDIEVQLTISNTPTPGVFNDNELTGGFTGSILFQNRTASEITPLLADLRYNPYDYLEDSTEVLNYSLTVNGLNLINNLSTTIQVPKQIEFTNIDIVRNYTSNTVENAFNAVDSIQIINNANPLDNYGVPREFTVVLTASNGFVTNTPSTYPYENSLTLGPANLTDLNNALTSTSAPPLYVPPASSTANEIITIVVKDASNNTLATETIDLTGTARTAPIAGEGLYTRDGIGSSSVTLTAETILYGKIDVLINSASGDGGYLDSYYADGFKGNERADSSSGGDGGLIEFQNQSLSTFPDIMPGNTLTLFNDNSNSYLNHQLGGNTREIIIVSNGGEGGAGDLSQTSVNGKAGANSGGGGFYSIDEPAFYPVPYTVSGDGGPIIPNSYSTNYFTNPVANIYGDIGTSGSAGFGEGGTSAAHTSSISGSSVSYRTVGGSGGSWDGSTLISPGNGQSATSLLRITQK